MRRWYSRGVSRLATFVMVVVAACGDNLALSPDAAPIDARIADAAPDSVPDASLDASPDASPDAPVDAPPDSAPSDEPTITIGAPDRILLSGTIVTPETILDGQVLVEGNLITCVASGTTCAACQGGAVPRSSTPRASSRPG